MIVVNVRRFSGPYHNYFYIGRPGPLGNPYSHRPSKVAGTIIVSSVEEAIIKFDKYARENQELMDRIKSLPEDATLGCWCKPGSCHGDVIIKLWREMHNTL